MAVMKDALQQSGLVHCPPGLPRRCSRFPHTHASLPRDLVRGMSTLEQSQADAPVAAEAAKLPAAVVGDEDLSNAVRRQPSTATRVSLRFPLQFVYFTCYLMRIRTSVLM